MSGIVGSRLNIRGSGVVGKLGTDGQVFTSAGAGKSAVYEDASGFDVSSITGATALGAQPAQTDEMILSDAGTLKRMDFQWIAGTPAFKALTTPHTQTSYTTETFGKITASVEVFDAPAGSGDGCYNNTGSDATLNGLTVPAYSFFPNVPGWYMFFCGGYFQDATIDQVRCTTYMQTGYLATRCREASEYYDVLNGSGIQYMDGTDDYVYGRIWHNKGSDAEWNGTYAPHFAGFRLVGLPTS